MTNTCLECGKTPVAKSPIGFTCIVCDAILKNVTTFRRHLRTSHDLAVCLPAGNVDITSEEDGYNSEEEESEIALEADDSAGAQEDNKTKERCKFVPLQPLTLGDTGLSKKRKLNYNEAVWATSSSLNADDKEKNKLLLTAKLGDWEPLIFATKKHDYHLLSSGDMGRKMLQDNPQGGVWLKPIPEEPYIPARTEARHVDHLIDHLARTSKAAKHLQEYTELTSEISKMLNGDWDLHPQLKYISSLLFAGAILLDDHAAIMVNTIEPYGRSPISEAHYERRLEGLPCSYPTARGQYGYLGVFLLHSTDTGKKKLVIGTRSSNLLVTSSIRLDITSVNVGATTTHFESSSDTRIFLSNDALQQAVGALHDETLNQSQTIPALFQLKQVRSKFHKLSTYDMCRASSDFCCKPQHQPASIWTLCEQDSSQKVESAAKLASRLFRTIALQVIKRGPDAQLQPCDVEKILHEVSAETKIGKMLHEISMLLGERPVQIIGNEPLSHKLTDLAAALSSSLLSMNKTKAKTLEALAYV